MRIALTGEIGMALPVLLEGGLQIIWNRQETVPEKRAQDSGSALPAVRCRLFDFGMELSSWVSARLISKSRSGRSCPRARNCRAREYPDCRP
ncbi:hypothetical protein B5K08_31945 [Rhizobium leguminosarum bv. trifolii]|uniref:Uncharacterized protein n=1 Tax=Rhizobium leguminosarum bv. trifolii TaxID=386 RepID=A0A3E1AZC3_RHILT|nr:hypothetical protein B5K10_31940 [Rhizobium leguminosarum bv. trifolii]RFB82814.1 hypothetical protein B5K08_31945 [Rhizobium leguminosarum bv. trifolii]